MKRLNNLWQHIIAFDNLLLAYHKARRGKQRKRAVAEFTLNLEPELFSLQQQLTDGSYQPGEYRLFTLYERKPRLIAAAPFRDRVVHHALMNIVEPPLDKQFIDDSYACRQGKGVHKAVNRYQNWANRYCYALKMDIQQYFPSIDRILLKQKLRRRIKDANVLNLFDQIIDTANLGGLQPRGLPIGNLTSQFLANLYLDDFDHYIKEQLRIKAYLRYVDDFIVLDDDKNRLHAIREQIREYLAQNHLRLHPNKAHIVPTRQGLDVLGYIVFPHKRLLRNDNGHRFVRKLHALANGYATGKITCFDTRPPIRSWVGHAKHANTYGLRREIFDGVIFRRKGNMESKASALDETGSKTSALAISGRSAGKKRT
jgi:RNA-directed DNA polymerase